MFCFGFVFLVLRGKKLHSVHIFKGFILLYVGFLIIFVFWFVFWVFPRKKLHSFPLSSS